MEFRPLGLFPEQLLWFRYEVDAAVVLRRKQVVIFQHHYPFRIWEDFGNQRGLVEWREIVQTRADRRAFRRSYSLWSGS